FVAGLLIFIMGIARMCILLKYISYPLIVGFSSGIALIIFSSQIKDFFGLPIQSVPADFVAKWVVYLQHMDELNWISFVIALCTVLIGLYFHNVTGKVPGSVVAIILSLVVV